MIVNDEDFSYINTKFLNDLQLNACSSIPESKEAGKIINNYNCYVACPMNTENGEVAEIRRYSYFKTSRWK